MSAVEQFRRNLDACPLIAILRGIAPAEIEAVGGAILEAGISVIEVSLKSPNPYASIARLAKFVGRRATIGAGTVLTPEEVRQVAANGGQLIVAPNIDLRVIATAIACDLIVVPGYFTPSEAFAALHAGAHCLKLFPAEAASPAVLRAHRAVLPTEVPLIAVGGVGPTNLRAYLDAGAAGCGLGSTLYRSGMEAQAVRASAAACVAALGQ